MSSWRCRCLCIKLICGKFSFVIAMSKNEKKKIWLFNCIWKETKLALFCNYKWNFPVLPMFRICDYLAVNAQLITAGFTGRTRPWKCIGPDRIAFHCDSSQSPHHVGDFFLQPYQPKIKPIWWVSDCSWEIISSTSRASHQTPLCAIPRETEGRPGCHRWDVWRVITRSEEKVKKV